MNMWFRTHRRRRGLLRVCAVSVTGMAVVAAYAADDAKRSGQMIVTPIEDAKFAPVDPQRPQGAQMAVLGGDPNTGPSAMLLRMNKGVNAMHVHSADYHCVVLEGTMQHWEQGQSQDGAKLLRTGSFWFQPGNTAHNGACLTDRCLMYVQWAGKRDGRLASR
jgi:quercetin dioxygenase-like cupin family protein